MLHGDYMRIVRKKAVDVRSEFVLRGRDVIRQSLAEFFSANPDVYSISFKTESVYSGHDYSDYSKIYDFRVKLEPISPGMGNDIENYVEVHSMPVGHVLREYVGSLALILRELRYSALDMFGCGTTILRREDWVPVEVYQHTPIDIPGPCVNTFEM